MFELRVFPLPNLDVEIGTTILEVCDKLGIEAYKYPYGNYLVAQGDAESILDVAVNHFSLDCYGFDGPLERVEYGLDPCLIEHNKFNFKKYLECLESQLGPAEKIIGSECIQITSNSSQVLANASWSFDIFDIYTAIYGGIRTAGLARPVIGQLSFTWKDIVTAGSNALKKQNKYVQSLGLEELDPSRATLFVVDHHKHYSESEADNIRITRRALNRPLIFETPEPIKKLLTATGSAIAFIPTSTAMLVCNSIDSTILSLKGENIASCLNMLPAKGSGGMSLSVSGVNLDTEHSSKQIEAIIEWLGRELDIRVAIDEYYDC